MRRMISVELGRHQARFDLTDPAHQLLERYLSEAGSALSEDPDRAEILQDLEHSIGQKLLELGSHGGSQIGQPEMQKILDAVGQVEGETPDPRGIKGDISRRKRLVRVNEGKWFAGVCVGIAVRGDYDLGWVRTIVVLLTLVTGGVFAFVYLGMAFWLPVVPTPRDY